MSAAATGGTIVINSAPTRHSSMALDYEMGLVRVAASSAAFGNSAAGFRVRPNDVTMIAPSTPTKIVRSCPSTPTGLKTAHGPLTGIVTKLNNKRSKVEIEEQPVGVDGKPLTEHGYSGGGNGIVAESQAKLRNLLVAQLDLIKKQSDAIITKDRQLRELRQENRALQQRLVNLGQNSNTTANLDIKKGTVNLINETLPSNTKSQYATIVTKDKAVETTSDLLENYSKLPKAQDSSSVSFIESNIEKRSKSDEQNRVETLHLSSSLETDTPYYTFHGEDFINAEEKEIKQILSQAEVPGWRTLAIPTCYSMEGTENIEDETVLKRHNKPELDEKRRKRWDLQRLRQQKQVERLRARYDSTEPAIIATNSNPKIGLKKAQATGNKNSSKVLTLTTENIADGIANNGNSFPPKPGSVNVNSYACGGVKDNDWVTGLQPVPELATHIHVSEKLPVNAFGFCVPMIPKKDFSLPWLNKSTKDKSSVGPKKCNSSKTMKNIKFSSLSTCSTTQKGVKKTQGIKAASQKITHSVNGHINAITTHQYQQNAIT